MARPMTRQSVLNDASIGPAVRGGTRARARRFVKFANFGAVAHRLVSR